MNLLGWTVRLPLGVQAVLGLLTVLLDVYMMLRIMNDNALYGCRTYLAPSLFVLLLCGMPFVLPLTEGLIALPLLLTGCFILLTAYQQDRAVSEYAAAFILFGTAIMLVPGWVWLIPFVYVACGLQRTLTVRTFLASLLGLITPFWITAGILFCSDEMAHFVVPFTRMAEVSPFAFAAVPAELVWSFLLIIVLTLPPLISYPSAAAGLKERTRMAWLFLITLCIGTLLTGAILPASETSLFPLAASLCGLLATQMLTTHTRARGIYLLVTAVLLTLYLTHPLWNRSLTFL